MDTRLKEKLQKLRNLAERGVGGEKVTAQEKLAQLLAANGLTQADIDSDTVQYYLFSYKFPYRKKLLVQIMYKVLGTGNYSTYHSRGTRNKVGVYCTAAQKLEIELDFEFYSNLLDEEISILTAAFISKQDLFPEDAPVEVKHGSDLSKEELAFLMKRDSYANQMTHRERISHFIEAEGES